MQTSRLAVALISLFVLNSVAACTAGSTPAVSRGSAGGRTSAPQPTAVPSPTTTPTPEPVDYSTVLKNFPLKIGATWVYSVTVAYYQATEAGAKQVRRSGLVTQTVASSWQAASGLHIAFGYQQNPPDTLLEGQVDEEYVVNGNSIFVHGRETFQFPLQVGQQWNPFKETYSDAAPGWYLWRVTAKEPVKLPNGSSEDCYQLEIQTQPDRMFRTFCPAVGVVKETYMHGGLGPVIEWELQRYQIP